MNNEALLGLAIALMFTPALMMITANREMLAINQYTFNIVCCVLSLIGTFIFWVLINQKEKADDHHKVNQL